MILKAGMIKIKNKYDFTNLSEFNFEWEVVADGIAVQSGKIPVPDLKPKADNSISLYLLKR